MNPDVSRKIAGELTITTVARGVESGLRLRPIQLLVAAVGTYPVVENSRRLWTIPCAPLLPLPLPPSNREVERHRPRARQDAYPSGS